MKLVDALRHVVGPLPPAVVDAVVLVQRALALAGQDGARVHVLARGLQLLELGAADALGVDGDVLVVGELGIWQPVGALGVGGHARVVLALALERVAAEGLAPRGRVVVARPVQRTLAVVFLGPLVRRRVLRKVQLKIRVDRPGPGVSTVLRMRIVIELAGRQTVIVSNRVARQGFVVIVREVFVIVGCVLAVVIPVVDITTGSKIVAQGFALLQAHSVDPGRVDRAVDVDIGVVGKVKAHHVQVGHPLSPIRMGVVSRVGHAWIGRGFSERAVLQLLRTGLPNQTRAAVDDELVLRVAAFVVGHVVVEAVGKRGAARLLDLVRRLRVVLQRHAFAARLRLRAVRAPEVVKKLGVDASWGAVNEFGDPKFHRDAHRPLAAVAAHPQRPQAHVVLEHALSDRLVALVKPHGVLLRERRRRGAPVPTVARVATQVRVRVQRGVEHARTH